MNKNLTLTEREKRIFCLLLENKVMTRQQLVRQVFPGLDSGNVTHRLNRMLNFGFINDYQDRRFSRKDILYELSGEGLKLAKSIYKFEFDQDPPRTYTYEHDVGLSAIREVLENKNSIKQYIPENILQCCPLIREQSHFKPFVEMMSDAVVTLDVSGKLKFGAIEYEPTAKWTERYREKILNYYVKPEISFVLYICKGAPTIHAIKTIEDEIKPGGNTKMFFCLYENVFAPKDTLTFVGRNQSAFEIN